MAQVVDIDAVFHTGLYPCPPLDLDRKTILITGGTGCLGSRLTEIICTRFNPSRVIVFSRDEAKQFEMAQRLKPAAFPALRFALGDVRDLDRLVEVMKDVDIVVHTAALKHVTISEQNPVECLRTNAHGTHNVIQASIRNGVRCVSVISTDKAVQPVNIYGASKLAAEKIATACPLGAVGAAQTAVHVVRFGNFVGSRGSVIPIFENLIRNGTPRLPVTDKRMTRFWITVEEAVNFTLSCLHQALGGEIFVPKLRSMAIVELAKAMAPALEIEFTGLRDGEKLHETLIASDASSTVIELEDRFVVVGSAWAAARESYIRSGGKPVTDRFSLRSENCLVTLNKQNVQPGQTNIDNLRLMAD